LNRKGKWKMSKQKLKQNNDAETAKEASGIGTVITPENPGRDQAGRWQRGVSGNRAGKPPGARHKATLAAEALLEGEAEALSRKAIQLALAGDVSALRICLDRIVPARKDRPVWFDLPKMNEARDAVNASAAIAAAVAGGDLTPSEAAELSKVIDGYARSLQTVELEERLSKLEKAIAK
jgi:hypothetical protein